MNQNPVNAVIYYIFVSNPIAFDDAMRPGEDPSNL